RHREQDERVVRLEGRVEDHHRREPRLDEEHRQARQPERERHGHAHDHQQEERAEQPQRRNAWREHRLGHTTLPVPMSRCVTSRPPPGGGPSMTILRSARSRSQPNANHVSPVSGHAAKMKPIGRSASSEVWAQPNIRNLYPYHTNTSAKTSTNTIETTR